MRYRVVLEQTDEGYAVSVPVLPDCHSQGRTEPEALANIAEAIRDYQDAIVEDYEHAVTRFVEVEDPLSSEEFRKLL